MDLKKIPYELLDDLFSKTFTYGGRGPDSYDCYGIVIEIYARLGISFPDFSSFTNKKKYIELIKSGVIIEKITKPEARALIIFKSEESAFHIAICLSSTEFVEFSAKSGFRIRKLNSYISSSCEGFYRCLI